MPLFEFNDQPWFPTYLRDYVTDGLQSTMSLVGIYRSIADRLKNAFQTSKATRVVDPVSYTHLPAAGFRRKLHRLSCS